MNRTTVVLGASEKPERFSNKAIRLLGQYGHSIIPVHPRLKSIEGLPVTPSLKEIKEEVDTVTMYIGPQHSADLAPAITQLRPKRVIFNPGSYSAALASELARAGIEVVEDCTLVMLRSGRY